MEQAHLETTFVCLPLRPVSWWCEQRKEKEGGHGIDFSLLFSHPGGELLTTMAGSKHHRHRWLLWLGKNLGRYGDCQVPEFTLGCNSIAGMACI